MSTTANALIGRALQLIGVLASGESPSSDEGADGLIALNDMVAAWATEPLTIYAQARTTQALSASTAAYTIGTGAAISVARPLWVANAAIIPAGATNEIPIDVLTDDEWAQVLIKSQTSTFPTSVFYDYGFTSSGYGTITVWPIPTTAPTLVLYLPTALTTFADLSTTYVFPPGYERMLRYNLAVELSPEYGRTLDPVIAGIAATSKANVKRANERLDTLRVDAGLCSRGGSGSYNWRTDR